MKTLLEVCREFARRTGLADPGFVVSNSDAQVAQLWGGMNELCEDLTDRKAWQATTKEKVHTSTAAIDQGNIYTLMDGGFQGIIPDTMFDRTDHLALTGAMSPQQWQAEQSLAVSGPYYRFRIRGDRLLFEPALPEGHIIAWEYYSNFFVLAQDGVTYKPYFDTDTDTLVFPDKVALSWLRWWWKKEKGLDYAEEFRKYEIAVAGLGAREAADPYVDMGQTESTIKPGIFIPEGNWMQP